MVKEKHISVERKNSDRSKTYVLSALQWVFSRERPKSRIDKEDPQRLSP